MRNIEKMYSLQVNPIIESQENQADFWLSAESETGERFGMYDFADRAKSGFYYQKVFIPHMDTSETNFVCLDGRTQELVMIKGMRHVKRSPVVSEWQHPLRQAFILSQLDHPNIAKFHDLIHVKNPFIPKSKSFGELSHVYLATKYIPDTKNLDDYALAHPDLSSISRVLLQVTDALSYMSQRRIMHGDIHPGNILVDAQGVPTIVDFDLAQYFEPNIQTIQSDYAENIPYAPPEQLNGTFTLRTDVYAWAQTITCILKKIPRYLYLEKTPHQSIHPDFEDVLQSAGVHSYLIRLLDRSRKASGGRPTMSQFTDELHAILGPFVR